MQAMRRARLESVILQELSVIVPRELKDPRIPTVTFTRAQVTEDGSQVTVWVTILGGADADAHGNPLPEDVAEKRMRDCIKGLSSAQGFLRRHFAGVLDIRHIPVLIFKEDRGLENTLKIHNLLKQIGDEQK